MRYVDELGMEWQVDLDGSLILAGLPEWPQSDASFLKECGIEEYEEIYLDSGT